MSCGVGQRRGLDPALLWLWQAGSYSSDLRLWEPPYAMGAALEKVKRQKQKKEEEARVEVALLLSLSLLIPVCMHQGKSM